MREREGSGVRTVADNDPAATRTGSSEATTSTGDDHNSIIKTESHQSEEERSGVQGVLAPKN